MASSPGTSFKLTTIPGVKNPPPGVPHLPHAGPAHPTYGYPPSGKPVPEPLLHHSLPRTSAALSSLPQRGYQIDTSSSQSFRQGVPDLNISASPAFLRSRR